MTTPGDPLTRQRSPWVHLGHETGPHAQALQALGSSPIDRLERKVGDGTLTALVAKEPDGWHLSISHRDHRDDPGRYPRWDEITHARYALLPEEAGHVVMILPPPGEYVAQHPTTFHLHQALPREDQVQAVRVLAALWDEAEAAHRQGTAPHLLEPGCCHLGDTLLEAQAFLAHLGKVVP